MVEYAQTARSYALLAFLVTLSSWFFVREIERPSRGNRAGYVVASVLAVYAHYFALYVLAAHALTLVALRRRSALTREWLSVAAAILASCVPAIWIIYRSDAADRIGWIHPPSLIDFATVFSHFTGRSRLLFCGLLLGGFPVTFLAWRERRPWPVGFVAACLFVPLVLSFLASIARPMFLPRYLIICLPFLVLIGAAGLTRLRPPVLARGLVVLLAFVSVARLLGFYQREGPENWRDATQFVLDTSRRGDGFVFFPDYAHKPFDYYSRKNGSPEPPNLDEQQVAAKPRIWLIVRESDATANRAAVEQVRSSLTETFERAEQRRFSNVNVELYVRRSRSLGSG
jgi:mannosyltransferase